jgi:AraC-like DNA-binding protein
MFEFSFTISEHKDVISDLAGQLGGTVQDDLFMLPEKLGKGYLRKEKLPNKLDAYIFNFSLADDFWFNRSKGDKEYYVFICEEVTHPGKLITVIDSDRTETAEPHVSYMYLMSFLSDLRQYSPAGSTVKGIRVIISPEWLAGHLRIDRMEDVLQRYLQLKADTVHMKEMDVDSKQLMQEILDPPDDMHTDVHVYLQNRVTMILEHFFSWLHKHMGEKKRRGISKDDIGRMMEVERKLLADMSTAPSLEELARDAAISVTKLKTLFRQVYGMPPYVYFQQHRMLEAKNILLTTELSVHQIGVQLGYKNMSNFILAFRKVFHINPGELRNRGLSARKIPDNLSNGQ